MTRIKYAFHLMLALVLAAFLSSCGGSASKNVADSTKKADSAKAADSTAAAPKKAAAPTLAAPFDVAVIVHSVKDYDKWRAGYNTDSTNRKAAGLEDLVVGRGADNGSQIIIYEKASDVAKAKAFAADPKLKDAMDKAGVISKPEIGLFHVIRFNADSKEKQWVVVTHKVKDFDAWVKVYDGEGKEKRASQGMVDVALARGVDDPNLIQIVFDITDMAKAKAAITSGDKKKLMISAGLMGKPSIEFYTTADK